MTLMRSLAVAVMTALAAASSAEAQEVRTETVRFAPGTSGTTLSGSITGYQSVRYLVGVSAGQRMSVQLDTSNASNYFNVTGPGADAALYNGSIDGNGASLVIPSGGEWVIDVYLMRNAARRDERADYSLTIYVE